MIKAQILKINKERLDKWANDLADHHATPVITIAVGHDHATGQIHICTIKDNIMDRETMIGFLEAALAMLHKGEGTDLR